MSERPTLGPVPAPSDVRTGLTSRPVLGRSRPVVENDEFAGFARRVVAAHGRRIATGDVDGLADLAALADALARATTDAVTGLRAHGYAWSEIGNRLGITRQAAQQRWGATSWEATS